MSVLFRNYVMDTQYGDDYDRLREFYLNGGGGDFSFGRWDWMISHAYLDVQGLTRIGIWEEEGRIIGVVSYDTVLDGCCFFSLKDGYDNLCEEMIDYAQMHLTGPDGVMLAVRDNDRRFQDAALKMEYLPTQYKDCTAVFEIENSRYEYELPEGFIVTSMRERFDPYQYGRILWKGFNHELDGNGPYLPTQEDLDGFRKEFDRPNVNLDLKIAVVAPDGNFAAYCGMWQDNTSADVLVEPVATDPVYRNMGLGRAAVLEAIRRCAGLGAKHAYVGSSQQFYYNIGFKPFASSTFWTKK